MEYPTEVSDSGATYDIDSRDVPVLGSGFMVYAAAWVWPNEAWAVAKPLFDRVTAKVSVCSHAQRYARRARESAST